MSANFTPTFDGYTAQQPFRYWCQTVLPLVYDDSLSYYGLLNKVVTYLNNVITDVSTVENNVDALLNAYQQLQNYVHDYFENLNVQDEINNKLDEMATDGTLSRLISPHVSNLIGKVVSEQINETVAGQIDNSVAKQIDNAVAEQINIPASLATTNWLQEHVSPVGSAVIVDDSLTIDGAAADAKKTGDDIRELKSAIVRHGYTLVDKDGVGNYKTVTEAVKNAQNGDIIVVNPGVYENEVVEAWGKEIHIVGVSRELCIIKNALSTYSTPPIEIGCGTLENLTIIAEYGTGKSSDRNGLLPYAVHTEDNNLANKALTIRNCTLISELNAAFGLGMRGGCTVNVCDSSLVGRVGVENRALYFHDADNSTYAGIQTINVCNCEMLSDSSVQTTLRIIDQNISGSTVNVRFVNNLLWNKAGTKYRLGTSVSGGASGSGWRNMVNVVLDGASYGNNMVALNAQ